MSQYFMAFCKKKICVNKAIIANEILMYLRSASRRKSEVSLQDPIGMDREGNETTYMDVIENEDESVPDIVEHNMETRRMYSKIISALKDRERDILTFRYGLFNKPEKTQSEIARIFGISRSYVSRIEKKALQKLFRELKHEVSN